MKETTECRAFSPAPEHKRNVKWKQRSHRSSAVGNSPSNTLTWRLPSPRQRLQARKHLRPIVRAPRSAVLRKYSVRPALAVPADDLAIPFSRQLSRTDMSELSR